MFGRKLNFWSQQNQSDRLKETGERNERVKIGYARVSTEEQNLDMQLEKLRAAGCDPIFTDRMSGASDDRPGLNEALERLGPGDVLVVWRLDRLGRSVLHLVGLLEQLHRRKIEFCSLTDNIDTTTPFGELHFTMVSALAQFERRMISLRTKETMQSARAKGIKFGRKPKLTLQQAQSARILLDEGLLRREVASTLKVSEPTLRRSLRAFGLDKKADGESSLLPDLPTGAVEPSDRTAS